MINPRVSPKPLRIFTWLSLCLSLFTVALSLMALGIFNLTIFPAVSCATLVYLVVIFILEHKHQRRKVQGDDYGSQAQALHPFPLSPYSTLPSIVAATLLGLWWFAVATASFFGLISTKWGGWSLHLVLVCAYFYAAMAETAVCFAFAIIVRRERGLSF